MALSGAYQINSSKTGDILEKYSRDDRTFALLSISTLGGDIPAGAINAQTLTLPALLARILMWRAVSRCTGWGPKSQLTDLFVKGILLLVRGVSKTLLSYDL